MGAYLERVLRLAGEVGGYERFEHGKEEHVSGYERLLRDLTGGAPGNGLGRLREQDFPGAVSDLEVQLRPGEESAVKGSVDAAHEAFTGGDYSGARYHLGNAKQTVLMSRQNAGTLRRVLTEAQAHMSNKANGPPEGTYPAPPMERRTAGGRRVIGWGSGKTPEPEFSEIGIGLQAAGRKWADYRARHPKQPREPKLPRLLLWHF